MDWRDYSVWLLWAILIVLAVSNIALFCTYVYGTERPLQFTVKSERTVYIGKSPEYLIRTDHGVLEDANSWGYLKFNAPDIYNTLQSNKTYRTLVYGLRIPFLGLYPNIVRVK